MKRLLICIGIALVIVGVVEAADISSGHVFTPGEQNITDVEMNAIVGGATINTTFFTDKSALAPSAADVFLYYSVGNTAYRKTTLSVLLLANTALITGQSEDGAPAGNDFVLTYDTSAASFKKVALQNLVLGSTNIFDGLQTISTPLMTDKVALESSATNALTTISNLFRVWNYSTLFTNLMLHMTPTNGDILLIYDSVSKTNRSITLAGTITNLPPITSVGNAGDTIALMSNGLVMAKTTLGALKTNNWLFPTVTNAPSAFYVDLNAGGTTAMGFTGKTPGAPQFFRFTLICTNVAGNDGFALNDEVPIEAFQDLGQTNSFRVTHNGINCHVFQSARPLRVWNPAGANVAITNQAMWKLKFYAAYFP